VASTDRRPEEAFDPRVEEAVATLRTRASFLPDVGVVLGSGLGHFAESLGGLVRIPYSAVPHLRAPGVPGHAGSLCFGDIGDTSVACLSGRVHLYEGHPVADVVLGCRILAALGCRVVILTNAAGGIRPGMKPGSLMLIVDHLNLTGHNPLTGGPRFVDMTRAYDVELCDAARRAAAEAGVPLAEGVYAQLSGPSYETPAEIRMLRTLGADAVGMSTVLETIALRALGVRVGAMSCITNVAAGLSSALLDHGEVQDVAREAARSFEAVLARWVVGAGELAQEGVD
jgi:purine-nucleoside phosphorylase